MDAVLAQRRMRPLMLVILLRTYWPIRLLTHLLASTARRGQRRECTVVARRCCACNCGVTMGVLAPLQRSHPAAGSTAHRRANRHGRAKSQGGNAAFGGARSGASTYRQGGATNGASGARRAGAAAGAGVGVGAGAGVPMVDTDGTGNYAGAQDEFGGLWHAVCCKRRRCR